MPFQFYACLIIFVVTVINYCIKLLPMGLTALLSLMALILTGCLTSDEALLLFSNSNLIMIGSMMVVAAGFNRTQFCNRLALGISHVARGNLRLIIAGYCLAGMLLSQFIQAPTAVFGILAPMAAASVAAIGVSSGKIMFPLGVTTLATCSTLPLGTGATVFAELNGYLESYGYTDFVMGIMDPAKARTPLIFVCILYMVFIAPRFTPDKPSAQISDAFKSNPQKTPLKPFQETCGYVVFILTSVALMLSETIGIPVWEVSLFGALLMVFCGVLKYEEAIKSIPADMLFLIMGALGLSGALTATGVGNAIGNIVSNLVVLVDGNSYLVGAMFFVFPFLMTQFMNNRGTMMVFYPIAIATCASIGANPIGLMILIQASCVTAFITPMATPSVPYIMSAGGYDQKDMFKMSWLPAILFAVVSVGWIMTVFPLF